MATMSRSEFIEFVAQIARADWQLRKIMLPSIVVAQACKESGLGTTELAKNANALFGIKLNGWTGESYTKVAYEMNPDGSQRVVEETLWRKYASWDDSIIDHNTYIAERKVGNQKKPNFKSVIGETNLKKALAGLVGNDRRTEVAVRCTDSELRKYVLDGTTEYGYATGLGYVQSLLDDYIIKYNLTQYDVFEEEKEDAGMLRIAFSAGHGKYTAGKRCMKALDVNETREWILNDRIVDMAEEILKDYNCVILRVDDTTGVTDVGNSKRAQKSDEFNADVYIAIHHDAGKYGRKGGGTTVFHANSSAERVAQAKALYNCIIAETGLVGDRTSPVVCKKFTEIKKCRAKSWLVENGFMDSPDDVPIILSEEHARKTANGIVNFLVKEFALTKKEAENEANTKPEAVLYKVQVGAFSVKAKAEALRTELKSKGYDARIVEM